MMKEGNTYKIYLPTKQIVFAHIKYQDKYQLYRKKCELKKVLDYRIPQTFKICKLSFLF